MLNAKSGLIYEGKCHPQHLRFHSGESKERMDASRKAFHQRTRELTPVDMPATRFNDMTDGNVESRDLIAVLKTSWSLAW